MNSRTVLEQLGLTKDDAVDLCVLLMPDMTLEDLNYVQMSLESEIEYREENGLLDDSD